MTTDFSASPPARLVRRVRNLIFRPLFRRRLERALRTRPVRRVAMVCQGNRCRSPFAAAVMARVLSRIGRNGITVISAGFSGSGYRSPDIAITMAERFGIDLAAHRSVTATAALLESADLIVIMAPDQRRLLDWLGAPAQLAVAVLGDFDPDESAARAIDDPLNGDEARFRECYRRIERCVRELAVVIARNASS